jgi:Peptidase M15
LRFLYNEEKLMGHFKVSEFDCKCKTTRETPPPAADALPTNLNPCGAPHISATLLCALERVREKFEHPITVTSGVRCPAHNKFVGGVKSSQHLLGTAADITCAPEHLAALYTLCWREPAIKGLGNGLTTGRFIHVDVRPGDRKEWTYS